MTNKVNKIIAYQGIEGSNSYRACKNWYPDFTPKGYVSFDEAISEVENGNADIVIIPIENSQGGRVSEIHSLIFKLRLFIIGEYFLKIEYVLCALPDSDIKKLKVAISHPQALAQCRNNLKALKLETQSYGDTAGAAKFISESNDLSLSAIATKEASDIYNLVPLRNRMEDNLFNTTRFISLAKNKVLPEPNNKNVLTSLVFTTKSIPAALYKSLGGFATNAVNIIKLESNIIIGNRDISSFYIEIEGNIDDISMQNALEELQLFANSIRILGSYDCCTYRQGW